MKRPKIGNPRHIIGLFLTVIILATTVILPATNISASKISGKQSLRTERKTRKHSKRRP